MKGGISPWVLDHQNISKLPYLLQKSAVAPTKFFYFSVQHLFEGGNLKSWAVLIKKSFTIK